MTESKRSTTCGIYNTISEYPLVFLSVTDCQHTEYNKQYISYSHSDLLYVYASASQFCCYPSQRLHQSICQIFNLPNLILSTCDFRMFQQKLYIQTQQSGWKKKTSAYRLKTLAPYGLNWKTMYLLNIKQFSELSLTIFPFLHDSWYTLYLLTLCIF